MILKGSTRSGALDLGLHLSNAVDNETVTIAEIKGAVASDIYSAFREWELIGHYSKTKYAFYSLSINPDPSQRPLTDQEWQQAADHIEKELSLTNQPRAIVFHEKEGDTGLRKHVHIVWSRIKTDNGQLRAIPNSHDYYKLRRCAQELSKQFGLELNHNREKGDAFDHAKSHGRNRDPETAAQRKETITKLWHTNINAKSFTAALSEYGYILAQGNRRAFVIVDRDGDVHSLPRQIKGMKAKDIKERLGSPDHLPSVEQAKAQHRKTVYKNQKTEMRHDLSREHRRMAKLRRMAIRADKLRAKRNKALLSQERQLREHHRTEKQAFARHRGFSEAKRLKLRAAKAPKGKIKKILDAIGVSEVICWLDEREGLKYAKHYQRAQNHISARQRAEQSRLIALKHRLKQQEKRETKTIRHLARKLNLQHTQIEAIKHAQQKSTRMTQPPPRLI